MNMGRSASGVGADAALVAPDRRGAVSPARGWGAAAEGVGGGSVVEGLDGDPHAPPVEGGEDIG